MASTANSYVGFFRKRLHRVAKHVPISSYLRDLRAKVGQALLLVRHDNLAAIEFYRRLGYMDDKVVSLGRRLEHDGSPDEPPRPMAAADFA